MQDTDNPKIDLRNCERMLTFRLSQFLQRFLPSVTRRHGDKPALVHPCVIDGRKTLIYEQGLELSDPATFRYLVNYARYRDLELREDRRRGERALRQDNTSNIIPVMLLGASLVTGNVQAGPHAAHQVNMSVSRSLDSGPVAAHDEDTVRHLVQWIHDNSSLEFNDDVLPAIVWVSARAMVDVAFGKNLPKSVNPDKLQIFGLYNFRDKSIYLLDTIDLNTEEGKAILLHEIVHYLQYSQGMDKNVACKNELEKLAYSLEAYYLETHGASAGFSEAHVHRVSRCS